MADQPDFSGRRQFSVYHNAFAQKTDLIFGNNIGNPGEIGFFDFKTGMKKLIH